MPRARSSPPAVRRTIGAPAASGGTRTGTPCPLFTFAASAGARGTAGNGSGISESPSQNGFDRRSPGARASSSGSVRASSRRKGPIAVRRSDARWAPEAERLSDVVGERADVRARRARDAEARDVAVERENRELADGDRLGKVRHRLALPRQVVELPAVELLRRERRRRLLDLARERAADLVEARGLRAGIGVRLSDGRPLRVVRVRHDAEAHRALVRLLPAREERLQPPGAAHAQHEKAGRGGVERPRVPDAARPEEPARHVHDVVGRELRGLVDEEEAGRAFGARRRSRHSGSGAASDAATASTAAATSGTSVAFAEASVPATRQPEALRCPPPA